MKKYNDFIKEGNVGMGSGYVTEYPLAYNTMENPTDRGKEGNIEYHRKDNMFQSIQDQMKIIIRNHLQQKNKNISDQNVEEVLHNFFNLGDNKKAEIKQISDNCKDPIQCAKAIFNKYLQYVRVNFYDKDIKNDIEGTLEGFNNLLNENKLNGKYGFFMFLDIIDDTKNSFIREDYLNTSDFYVFFTTNKIENKDKLSDKLEYKKSLDVAYETFKHIGNLRLSFYFGVRDYILEYGFHDDLKRVVYKIGEFKVGSIFLRSISSYKCVSLIRNILKNVILKNLKQLKKIKTDLKFLLDGVGEVEILDEERVVCVIDKDIKIDNINDYFDGWCFKHKWYYTTYNYVEENQDTIDFMVKLKESDTDLNFMKKNTDIKNIQKIHEKETSNPEIGDPIIATPHTTAKLTARKYKPSQPQLNKPGIGKGKGKVNPYLKKNKKDKAQIVKKEKEDKNKLLLKYYKSLVRAITKISKDQNKDKGYLTHHIYKIVSEFDKPFNTVKNDIMWMNSKLKDNPDFLEWTTTKLKI